MKPAKLLFLILLSSLFLGCSGQLAAPSPEVRLPTPTGLPMFADRGTAPINSQPDSGLPNTGASQSGQFNNDPVAINFPTLTPYPTATWLPSQVPPPEPVEVPIYSDSLSSGWQVVSPDNEMLFNLQSEDQAHSGTRSIAVTPNKSHGKIYIVASPSNSSTYNRPEVLGIQFWIYSGERGLDQYDLAVTAIGSNDYTYWRKDDYSVLSKTPYEETFLRWLGYELNIAPFTWVPVQIWLNEMRFDPDYKYVTGLYITNRQGFTRTFYIDDISLQLPTDTSNTSPTLTPTSRP